MNHRSKDFGAIDVKVEVTPYEQMRAFSSIEKENWNGTLRNTNISNI